MSHYNLALLGFGNVGQALAKLLIAKREELQTEYDITYSFTGIATGHHGSAIDGHGLNIDEALRVMEGTRKISGTTLNTLSASPVPVDSLDFIRRCQADVLFENSPVNYETGQPAVGHIRLALENGMHVVTANKGPVVHAYHDLTGLAQKNGVKFYFESTVMDGAPVFSLFRDALPAANILSVRGVLNSTTNMILTRMQAGESFDKAVKYTQEMGIAETDPSGDIDGWDASVKVAALVTVLMGVPLRPQDVDRRGIRDITPEAVRKGLDEGKRWKLVCTARREGDGVRARVAPELVGSESPLYRVDGTTSIVQFETDVLGLFSIIEEHPGPETTAYGCLADFLNAVR